MDRAAIARARPGTLSRCVVGSGLVHRERTRVSIQARHVRHLYERRILTSLRIDGRVFFDRREIDSLVEKARAEA